jgi:hypothetical protein
MSEKFMGLPDNDGRDGDEWEAGAGERRVPEPAAYSDSGCRPVTLPTADAPTPRPITITQNITHHITHKITKVKPTHDDPRH